MVKNSIYFAIFFFLGCFAIIKTSSNCASSIDILEHGSIITIEHEVTKNALHSHPIRYEGESKQQEITCYWLNDSNNFWVINHTDLSKIGNGFKHGDIINLIHKNTGNLLHSHNNYKSPKTGQQEVTGFWGHDSNDNWELDLMGESVLKLGKRFRLIHKNTGRYLHSHSTRLTNGSGQQEVTGFWNRDSNDYWFVREINGNVSENVTTLDEKDIITIIHNETGRALHSHPQNYPTGSKQQEVTGYWNRDSNDYWFIEHVDRNKVGKGVQHDDIIRLIHKNTNNALHSHDTRSQVTGQFEVTCYDNRDDNDYWKVDLMGEKFLTVGKTFRLFHKNSGRALHSHNTLLTQGSKQQEVTTYWNRDSNDYWRVEKFNGKSYMG